MPRLQGQEHRCGFARNAQPVRRFAGHHQTHSGLCRSFFPRHSRSSRMSRTSRHHCRQTPQRKGRLPSRQIKPMRGAPHAPVNPQPQAFKGLKLPLHSWDRNQLKLLMFIPAVGIEPTDDGRAKLQSPTVGPIARSRPRVALSRNHAEGIDFIRENDLSFRKGVDFNRENALCFESDHRICIL